MLCHRKGSQPERFVAALFALRCLAGLLVRLSGTDFRFNGVCPFALTVDLAILAMVLAVALGANRTWPLTIAGLQLLIVIAHIEVLLGLVTLGKAYLLLVGPLYIAQYVTLAVGLLRHAHCVRRWGTYRDWRLTSPA